MKRLLAIGLLLLMVFNTVGYKLVFYWQEHLLAERMENRLDGMQNTEPGAAETITVKIPINLPYQTNWKDFERVDGEMTYKGTTYKYFKRKIYNDSLILVCVKFAEKNKLQNASDDYFKKVNDLAADATKKQMAKQLKVDDFYIPQCVLSIPAFATPKVLCLTNWSANYPDGFGQKLLMPPRQLV